MRALRLRIWRDLLQITQVIAGRAWLEPGNLNSWCFFPWRVWSERFIILIFPTFLHLKLHVINGRVLSTYETSSLLFMVNLWNYIILKSCYVNIWFLCGMLTAPHHHPCPCPPPTPLTTSVWWTHTENQGSSPLWVSVPSKPFSRQVNLPSPPAACPLYTP